MSYHSYYGLSPAMRRVIITLSNVPSAPQHTLPFHTLKALERRKVVESYWSEKHGAWWRLTRAGRVVAQLLLEG